MTFELCITRPKNKLLCEKPKTECENLKNKQKIRVKKVYS